MPPRQGLLRPAPPITSGNHELTKPSTILILHIDPLYSSFIFILHVHPPFSSSILIHHLHPSSSSTIFILHIHPLSSSTVTWCLACKMSLTCVSSEGGWAAGRGSCLATATVSGPVTVRGVKSLLGCWETQKLSTTQTPPTSCLTPLRSPQTPPTSIPPSPHILEWQADWPMGRGTRCWLAASLLRGRYSTSWSGRGPHLIRALMRRFGSFSSTLTEMSGCWLVQKSRPPDQVSLYLKLLISIYYKSI